MKTANVFSALLGTALTTITIALTGCAATPPPPPGLRIERQSAGGVQVQTVRLASTESGLLVSGSVGRSVGYSSSPYRHLDVEIVGAEGVVLARMATNFSPNPIRHSPRIRTHSSYGVTFPGIPPPGSVVRVTVHKSLLSECHNHD